MHPPDRRALMSVSTDHFAAITKAVRSARVQAAEGSCSTGRTCWPRLKLRDTSVSAACAVSACDDSSPLGLTAPTNTSARPLDSTAGATMSDLFLLDPDARDVQVVRHRHHLRPVGPRVLLCTYAPACAYAQPRLTPSQYRRNSNNSAPKSSVALSPCS